MDAELVQKIFNLTITNAIPMEVTMIMYLLKIFHSAKIWSVIHRAKESVIKNLSKISQKTSFFAQFRQFF